jgi:hypothetical protein
MLWFRAAWDFDEGRDGVALAAWAEGGSEWRPLVPEGGYPTEEVTALDDWFRASTIPGWSGRSDGWRTIAADLTGLFAQRSGWYVGWVFASGPGAPAGFGFVLGSVDVSLDPTPDDAASERRSPPTAGRGKP